MYFELFATGTLILIAVGGVVGLLGHAATRAGATRGWIAAVRRVWTSWRTWLARGGR